MQRFLLLFRQYLKLLATSNTCISVNIARKIICYISKSKLIFCEYNGFHFIEIAFIGFTLHEIKQGIVFFGTPGIYIYIYIYKCTNYILVEETNYSLFLSGKWRKEMCLPKSNSYTIKHLLV